MPTRTHPLRWITGACVLHAALIAAVGSALPTSSAPTRVLNLRIETPADPALFLVVDDWPPRPPDCVGAGPGFRRQWRRATRHVSREPLIHTDAPTIGLGPVGYDGEVAGGVVAWLCRSDWAIRTPDAETPVRRDEPEDREPDTTHPHVNATIEVEIDSAGRVVDAIARDCGRFLVKEVVIAALVVASDLRFERVEQGANRRTRVTVSFPIPGLYDKPR